MQSHFKTPQEYVDSLPEDRKTAIEKLRKIVKSNLPEGFQEEMSYGMLGFIVPLSIYPKGYHCNPNLPLPFINIASQKNFIAFYHMGIYVNSELLNWFVLEYSKLVKSKIDMGKSCIRFKKMVDIPYDLIGELASKIAVSDWISIYENNVIK
jgi:uncharacterized protein YdhG (YjbR/CyaY superfamily)